VRNRPTDSVDNGVDVRTHAKLKQQHKECLQEMQAILLQAEEAAAKVEGLTRQLASNNAARVAAEEEIVSQRAISANLRAQLDAVSQAKQGAEESLAILELRDESAERERVKIADELHETKAELYKIQKQLGDDAGNAHCEELQQLRDELEAVRAQLVQAKAQAAATTKELEFTQRFAEEAG